MNKRKLANQALRYLASLGQQLPDESDTDWYKQNSDDYQALLKLNNAGIGPTVEELEALANAPLTDTEIKRIVKRLKMIDSLVIAEYDKQEVIEKTPKYWDGFFSGYEASPTNRCKQLLNGIKTRIDRLSAEQSDLFKKITMQEAIDFEYCCDGMDEEDFKVIGERIEAHET
jgi:hypothetical protein